MNPLRQWADIGSSGEYSAVVQPPGFARWLATHPVSTTIGVLGAAGIAAKIWMPGRAYQQLMATTSTNATNLTHRPWVSLIGSGFVFPTWANVTYLGVALGSVWALERCRPGGVHQAAAAVVAGHLGVSAVIAAAQRAAVTRGKAPASLAHIPDDVGASYLAYAALTALATRLAAPSSTTTGNHHKRPGRWRPGRWRPGLPVVAAIAVLPVVANAARKPTTTNVGHAAAALVGVAAVSVLRWRRPDKD